MKFRTLLFATSGIFLLLSYGCGKRVPLVFPHWSSPPAPVTSNNSGFATYERIGNFTATTFADQMKYPTISDPEQAKCDKLVHQQIVSLPALLNQSIEFAFQPQNPFKIDRTEQGLGFFGEHFAWRISDELSTGHINKAIQDFLTGVRYSQILLGGDIADAVLGDELMNRMRQSITPSLPLMGAGQLEQLSNGLAALLSQRPLRAITITNEQSEMMRTVDQIQKLCLRGSFSSLRKDIGPVAEPSIEALSLLPSVRSRAGISFFQGLAKDANTEGAWLTANGDLPSTKRQAPINFMKRQGKLAEWSTISAAMFSDGIAWLNLDDANLARMRLMTIYCQLLADVKTNHVAPQSIPQNLSQFDVDPYTGKPFFYVPTGAQFLLYSAGTNGLDDGGQTDSSFTTPDLFLENTAN